MHTSLLIRTCGTGWRWAACGSSPRFTGKDRRFIKGQRYNLLSRRENLTTEGRQALRLLFRANKRLHTAYLLKESFGQLWDYNRPGWARRLLENWKGALRWARPGPFRQFSATIQ